VIEVLVDAPAGAPGAKRVEDAVRAALAARGIERAEVSVALVDDETIRALNREHLGHDRPTDVIAFGLWAPGDPLVVGDVYLGLEQALRQAADEDVDPAEEIVRLSIHGALHVAGMDHPDDPAERAGSEMYRLQERLVRQVGGGPPGGG
jgi:probable rRNA maturation factor